MLAISHIASGALIGARCRSRRSAVVAGLLSHLLLDGIDHDDDTIGLAGQAVLGAAGLLGLLRGHRITSPAVAGALAAVLPDVEIAVSMLCGRKDTARYGFPSHWGPPGSGHPYRLPRVRVPAHVEAVVAALAVAVVARG